MPPLNCPKSIIIFQFRVEGAIDAKNAVVKNVTTTQHEDVHDGHIFKQQSNLFKNFCFEYK